MDNKLLLFILFNICLAPARGQTLKGFVVIQNKKNLSAVPATVHSKEGGATDAVVADPDGSFKLVFGGKSPGYAFSLEVLKPGYEVVNKKELRGILPENPEEQRALKIYICKKGEWQQHADSFFQINYRQITARQQKKLTALNTQLQTAQINIETYRQGIEELQRQQKLMIEEAGRLALLFASANLDDESERFRRAADYFARGLIDSVLVALPEEDLLRDLECARQQIDDGEMLQQIAAENLGLAQNARDSVLLLSGLLASLQNKFSLDSFPLTVAGRILADADASPVSGALIRILNWQGISDADGYFETVLLIPVGFSNATLSVQASGFEPQHRLCHRLNAGKLKVFLYKKE